MASLESRPSFLRLPRAIRQMVYHEILSIPEILRFDEPGRPPIPVSVLRVCKQLHEECAAFLYGENVFHFSINDGVGLVFHPKWALHGSITSCDFARIRYMSITIPIGIRERNSIYLDFGLSKHASISKNWFGFETREAFLATNSACKHLLEYIKFTKEGMYGKCYSLPSTVPGLEPQLIKSFPSDFRQWERVWAERPTKAILDSRIAELEVLASHLRGCHNLKALHINLKRTCGSENFPRRRLLQPLMVPLSLQRLCVTGSLDVQFREELTRSIMPPNHVIA